MTDGKHTAETEDYIQTITNIRKDLVDKNKNMSLFSVGIGSRYDQESL